MTGASRGIGRGIALELANAGRWLHGAAIDMDGGQVDPLRMSKYD